VVLIRLKDAVEDGALLKAVNVVFVGRQGRKLLLGRVGKEGQFLGRCMLSKTFLD
jgi:hypothetical protein